MKKATLLVLSLFASGAIFAQNAGNTGDVITCDDFHITKPLTEIFANNPVDLEKVYGKIESEDREHNKPQRFPNREKDPLHYGNDPATMQTEMGKIPGKAPIKNWPGQTASGFYPLDPSGAAGPNHYVQMINATTFKIFNKSTGASMLTGTLGNIWSPALAYNDGDPIVLYDKAADRWFLAQFGDNNGTAGNKIHIAISTSPDPTGTYYTYTFTSPQFPDYLKFSVWQDGYYMTSNQTQRVFVFERSQMLAGNASARAISQTFSPPNAGYFFVPLPGDAGDGVLPPAGTPCPIFSYSDDGWGAGYSDAINIFKVTVNWAVTATETIASAGSVLTAAFDGSYDPSWNDCPQPGTSQLLDGIGGVLMYRAQWKTWSGYNSVVLNWGVKISATQRSIKWCELRQSQSTGVWSMYQQGIYTPDANTRWLGSIAMDNNGSIALCYLKANSSSIYPGLYYTGRRTCDPLGTLPVTEQVAIAGSGSQTGVNRDGDYAETWLDPDGVTFWHTGLYMGAGGSEQTRIYSFQIAPCASATPVANFTGAPTTICAGQSVTFTDASTNTPTSWAWTFTGGTPASSTVQNPVVVYNTPGTYSVTLTATNAGGSSTPFTRTNYITVNAVPAAPTAGSNSPVCAGSAINLTATPVTGATYSWTGPGAFTSTTQNPSRAGATAAMGGTYSVTASAGGCTSVAGTTTVVVKPLPTVTVPANVTICNGATVPASNYTSTVAGSTFTWTNSNTAIGLSAGGSGNTPSFAATNTGTAPISGTITVTATANGCTGSPSTYTITVNPTPSSTFTTPPSQCLSGNSFTFTNTGSTGTYSWTFGGGTPATSTANNPSGVTFSTAGPHIIQHTVTSAAGCTSATSTSTITVNAGPTGQATSTTNAGCGASNGTLTLGATTGGTSPYTYSVNGSAFSTTTSYTGLASGSYSVIVKDANGCQFTTSASIGSAAGPTAQAATATNSTCGNSNGTLTLGATTGGTGPYTYSVNGGAFSTTTAYTGLSSGTYAVIVKDANGCQFTTSATIANSAGPSAMATTTVNATCGNSNGAVNIGAITGGTAAYTYSLNGSAFSGTTNYTGLAAGTYTITVKDANGCTFTTSATVGNTGTTPATPTITQSGSTLTSSAATGNQWFLNGSPIAGATGQTFTFTSNGNYTVQVTVGGCTSASSAVTSITNVGIAEAGNNPYGLSVYPNPNDGHFTISFVSADRDSYKVEIFNALGQIVFRDELHDFSGTYNKEMSVVEYGQGVYTISLTNSRNETVKKIIVY